MKKIFIILTILALAIPVQALTHVQIVDNPLTPDSFVSSNVDSCVTLAACDATATWADVTASIDTTIIADPIADLTSTSTDALFTLGPITFPWATENGDIDSNLIRLQLGDNNDVLVVGTLNEEVAPPVSIGPEAIGRDLFIGSLDKTTGFYNWKLDGNLAGDNYAQDMTYDSITGEVAAIVNTDGIGNQFYTFNSQTGASICSLSIDNDDTNLELASITSYRDGADTVYLLAGTDNNVPSRATLIWVIDCAIDHARRFNNPTNPTNFRDAEINPATGNINAVGRIGPNTALLEVGTTGTLFSTRGFQGATGVSNQWTRVIHDPTTGDIYPTGLLGGPISQTQAGICHYSSGLALDECQRYDSTSTSEARSSIFDTDTGNVFIVGNDFDTINSNIATLAASFDSGLTLNWVEKNAQTSVSTSALFETASIIGNNFLAIGQTGNNWLAQLINKADGTTVTTYEESTSGISHGLNSIADTSINTIFAVGQGTHLIISYQFLDFDEEKEVNYVLFDLAMAHNMLFSKVQDLLHISKDLMFQLEMKTIENLLTNYACEDQPASFWFPANEDPYGKLNEIDSMIQLLINSIEEGQTLNPTAFGSPGPDTTTAQGYILAADGFIASQQYRDAFNCKCLAYRESLLGLTETVTCNIV